MAGLLFLAFAYFAVGQAAFTRNGAQTAADAAALAAAQEARDQFREGWLEAILDPDQWDEFLQARADVDSAACGQAEEFAALNEATLTGDRCVQIDSSVFRVTVTTTGPERHHATATAEAVIEPRCSRKEQEPSSEPPTSSPPTSPPPGEVEEEEPEPIVGLMCGEESWEIDPENPTLPDAVDLFTVRLSE
ncbi:pilus assembly protein TadG-related protein [Streptomyces gardneri]